jgi:agmatinase
MSSRPSITRDVKKILKAGAFPVVIGGDHAVTYPVVRAYEERLNVVHFDAHMDYQPFVHGVQWANGNPIRNVSQLKICHHIIQVGIRSLRTAQSDVQDSRARGNDIVTVPDFHRRGTAAIVDRLPKNEPVYVSIDIDVLDMPLVPGCSSSEVNGLTYDELRQTLFAIARSREVIGFDLVEVNPMIDVASHNTSLVAAQLIVEFLGRIVEHPGYRKRHPMKATAVTAARVPVSSDGRGRRNGRRAVART